MAHIFISYSKANIAFARHLRGLLEAEGFSVWMDETRLVPSERWWPTIEKNIRTCAAFVVIMSPEAQASDWVEREILLAERRNVVKPIFPVLLSGEAWTRLSNIQYEDMTAGTNAVLSARLSDGLANYAARRVNEPPPPPLPGDRLDTGAQPLSKRKRQQRMLWLSIGGSLLALAGLGAFIMNSFNALFGNINTPTPPTIMVEATTAISGASSPTPAATLTPESTATPHPTNTPVPTLDATQIEASITAEMALIALRETATIAFNQTATALPTPLPTATAPSGSAVVGQGVDVYALCDNPSFGIAAPSNLAAGMTIDIYFAWFAQTRQQVEQHVAAAVYEVRLDGNLLLVPPPNFIRPSAFGGYEAFWYIPTGQVASGQRRVTLRLMWNSAIFDGSTNFGPGTGITEERGSCTFNVR